MLKYQSMRIFFILFLFLLSNCSSWSSAKKGGCLSPHASYYELETRHFAKKTRNYPTQSPKLLTNPFKPIIFKTLTYEERCEHTKTLIKALKDPNTSQMYYWKKIDNSTEGSIKILMDVPAFSNTKGIGNGLCRVYISKIRIKKKVKSKKFRACNYKHSWGPHDRFGYIIEPHITLNQWRIFENKYF